MLEAISMKFLIASLTSALLMGQIVQMQALPGPHVRTLSLLHTLFLTGALFCKDTQSFFFISLCFFFPSLYPRVLRGSRSSEK